MTKKSVRVCIGTRQSPLAMAQANFVVEKLRASNPTYEFVIIGMTTQGDKDLTTTLSKLGGKALFTTELETELREERVDLVVHSLKDVPTTLPEGLSIGAILEREDPSDAVVFPKGSQFTSLDQLKKGAKIGTSSLRRIAQLRRHYQHLEFISVRGNLNTRLSKLDNGEAYDALVLAVSGLRRLNLADRISYILSPEMCLHAVGQGALAIEIRRTDELIQRLINSLNNRETALRCLAERSFMKALEGGCSVPLGVNSKLDESGNLNLKGGVFAFDGEQSIVEEHNTTMKKTISSRDQEEMHVGVLCTDLLAAEVEQAVGLGVDLAKKLLDQGAKELLDKARKDAETSTL